VLISVLVEITGALHIAPTTVCTSPSVIYGLFQHKCDLQGYIFNHDGKVLQAIATALHKMSEYGLLHIFEKGVYWDRKCIHL